MIDEHWQAQAVAAVRHYQETNPEGWEHYLAEAIESTRMDAPITDTDGWVGG